jgi:CRP/FNR family cyclic AMP-dependent transcriptional regulator
MERPSKRGRGDVEQRQDLLERVPLFAGISAAGIEELGAIANEVDVRAGTVLTHEGSREGFFFIVMEGTVRIERAGRMINTIGPGDFLGEISLLDAGPRTATAIADTPCRLLSMTYQQFHDLLDASPPIRVAILEAVGQRLRALDLESAI